MNEDFSNRQGIVMDASLRKAVKIAAIQRDMTISELVEMAVKAFLGMKQKEGK